MDNRARIRIADVQVQVSQNTEALQGAQIEKSDLTRQIQTLEIELASQQSLEELTQLRANIQQQTQEYQALLNIRVKLEAEIAMNYC
uniref:IF rod domain-containing protein n=1 Tax=Knipowitschia caucasica TaxID=637954 RepID=A0AAV2M4R1_KNICA